jgi:hypothetical protein
MQHAKAGAQIFGHEQGFDRDVDQADSQVA